MKNEESWLEIRSSERIFFLSILRFAFCICIARRKRSTENIIDKCTII